MTLDSLGFFFSMAINTNPGAEGGTDFQKKRRCHEMGLKFGLYAFCSDLVNFQKKRKVTGEKQKVT